MCIMKQMGYKLVYKEILIGHYGSTNLSIFSYFDIQCMVKAFSLAMELLIIVLMFYIAEL